MVKALLISLLIAVFAYGCKRDRQIIRQIKQGKLTITWHRELFIDKTVAFVSSEIDDKEDTLLMCAEPLITGIDLKKDTVVIKAYEWSNDLAYSKKEKDRGYVIKPENATYREWLVHYEPQSVARFDKGIIKDPTNHKKR